MYHRLLLLLIVLVAFGQPSATQAASLVILRSDPTDGALLAGAPAQIRVWLNSTALIDPASVQLTDASNGSYTIQAHTEVYQPIAAGLADRFDSAYLSRCALRETTLPTLLLVDLPPLSKGTYQIVWQISNGPGRKVLDQSLVFAVQASVAAPRSATTPLPTAGHLQAHDLVGSLLIRPNIPGQNFVALDLTSSRRPPPAIETVMLHLTPPDGGATQMVLVPADDHGQYLVAGEWFDRSGTWQIEVVVQRHGGEQIHIPIAWVVAAPTHHTEELADLLQWSLVLGCLLTCWLLLQWRKRTQ
ncbi:MAG: hypothetical protein Fur005_14660 [Roseiflexaceae bacterium]